MALTPILVHAESSVRMYVWAGVGPVRSASTTAASDTYLTNSVLSIYNTGILSNAIGDHMLKTEHVSQPADVTGSSNVLWFFIKVVATNSNARFLPNWLRFEEKSSDSGNSLGYEFSFANPNFVFSPRALGVKYNGAARVADTLLSSGYFTEVDEFIVAAQSKYYPYSDPAGLAGIDAFVMSFTNFLVTGTWALVDASSNVTARAHKTLATKFAPIQPVLSISVNETHAFVGINLETNRTIILQSRSPITGSWGDEATGSAGDIFTRIKENQRYFRAVLQ